AEKGALAGGVFIVAGHQTGQKGIREGCGFCRCSVRHRPPGRAIPQSLSGAGTASASPIAPGLLDRSAKPCNPARVCPRRDAPSGSDATQLIDEIGAFPGEAAIGLRRPAEMAIGTGSRVDRPVEAEMLANATRRKVHDLVKHLFELCL